MQAVLDFLKGKKSYIIAIAGAVFDIGLAFGWWPMDGQVITVVNTLFVALFGVALRAGVTKSGVAQ